MNRDLGALTLLSILLLMTHGLKWLLWAATAAFRKARTA